METLAYKVAGTWTEVSLLSLGVADSFRVTFSTHGESKVTLPLRTTPPETTVAIPLEAPCILYVGRVPQPSDYGPYSGGSILFQGRRTDNPGEASSQSAGQELILEDAWYDLRLLTFQATWANIISFGVPPSGGPAVPVYGTPVAWPDCVLFQASPGGPLQPNGTYGAYNPLPINLHITTGQAIKELLAYAIYFGGVNLQIGQIDPACYVPFYPVRSMRVADCIKVALRVHPDCTCEIDYTTTPPTFNVRARSNLIAITLPYKGSA